MGKGGRDQGCFRRRFSYKRLMSIDHDCSLFDPTNVDVGFFCILLLHLEAPECGVMMSTLPTSRSSTSPARIQEPRLSQTSPHHRYLLSGEYAGDPMVEYDALQIPWIEKLANVQIDMTHCSFAFFSIESPVFGVAKSLLVFYCSWYHGSLSPCFEPSFLLHCLALRSIKPRFRLK